MHDPAASGILRHIYACFYLTLLGFSLGSVDARQNLVSRAIVRPIPMPGFSVSVFDDATGAPIPQVQASDGGGLIGGKVFSAPNLIWAISAAVIGIPLGVAGVRLWRVTTALGGGLTLAFAMWTALINTVSESGLASSQSMSDMIMLLITGAAFLVGMIGGAFRLVVLPAMAATCALGGSSIAVRGVILRPGLLVPPGQDQRLALVNIVIVVVGALSGGLSVIFKQRESMIFSTSCISSFLVALAVDLLVNGQDGMSRGLRFLFDMNDNHIADLMGGGYNPPLSSQIIVASSLGIALMLCLIQHFTFPGPFKRLRPRDRTQSIDSTSETDSSLPFPQAVLGRTRVAPGPNWRTSVLSLFHFPGRSDMPILGKPGNEHRGSDAYNFSQNVYALPSELLRQQSQTQSRAPNSSWPNPQYPSVPAIPGRSLQFAGIGLRNYQEQSFAVRSINPFHNINNPSLAAIQYRGAQRVTPSRQSPRGASARFGIPRNAAAQSAVILRVGGGFTGASDSTVPRVLPPKIIPSSGAPIATLPPSVDAVPAPTPHLGIGMGTLHTSVDSIIDAYGGTVGTGYRYGGSRIGEGGRI